LTLGIFLAIHVGFCVMTGVMMYVGYDIIPFKVEKLPLDIRDDVDYLHEIAWRERMAPENNIIQHSLGQEAVSDGEVKSRTTPVEFVDMIFK